MKKALVDTTTSVQHIVSWSGDNAIYETYPNSARICEITDTIFEVHSSLIWFDCADDVTAEHYYYDTETKKAELIVNAEFVKQSSPDGNVQEL